MNLRKARRLRLLTEISSGTASVLEQHIILDIFT